MPVYQKFATFPLDFLKGKHNFETDVFHMMLSNVMPNGATDISSDDIVEIPAGNGYPAGGLTVSHVVMSLDDLTLDTVVEGDPVIFTAAGGAMGPLRYAVMFNFSKAEQRLVCFWDYGVSITLMDTETLTITFNAEDGIFRVD